jgi:hypothetical protein
MLHVSPAVAAELGEVLEPHCHGNPYETVELLNALRRDGVLTAASDGWRWETAAVRAHLTRAEAAGSPPPGPQSCQSSPGGRWRRWPAWAGAPS